MTKEEFKEEVKSYIGPKDWRKGQAIFNYIDEKYGVARQVQFVDHIDCFYDDSQIDAFIDACYKRLKK